MGGDRLYRVRVKIHWNSVDVYRMKNGIDGSSMERPFSDLSYEYSAYEFGVDELKKELISRLLRIPDIDALSEGTVIADFLIEVINFDVIMLLAAMDIRKNDGFREVIKEYLAGDMGSEEFHKEVVAYCVAEKMSK